MTSSPRVGLFAIITFPPVSWASMTARATMVFWMFPPERCAAGTCSFLARMLNSAMAFLPSS